MNIKNPGVGLLGGTFDPVHNGHVSIAKSFLNSDYLKELWILLTPDPPHKSNRPAADFDIRLDMLEATFCEYDDIEVSDIENRLPRPSYTVQTLSHLSKEYPNKNFYLCMGEDSLASFKQWHKWREILSYCNLLVAERPNTDHENMDEKIEGSVFFVSHDPVDISSTEIRKLVSEGKDISRFVPDAVEEIIRKKKLYQ